MRDTFANLFRSCDFAGFACTRHGRAVSVLRPTLILIPIAVAAGSHCAALVRSLDVVTRTRFARRWRLLLLAGGGVPPRMGPLIVIGTTRHMIVAAELPLALVH